MHSIIIQSDTLTFDHQFVKRLKELFPECRIQILTQSVREPDGDVASPTNKEFLQ